MNQFPTWFHVNIFLPNQELTIEYQPNFEFNSCCNFQMAPICFSKRYKLQETSIKSVMQLARMNDAISSISQQYSYSSINASNSTPAYHLKYLANQDSHHSIEATYLELDQQHMIKLVHSFKGPPVIPIPFTLMPSPLESQIQIGMDFGDRKDAPYNINLSQQIQDSWLKDKTYLDQGRIPPSYYQDQEYSRFQQYQNIKQRQMAGSQSVPSFLPQINQGQRMMPQQMMPQMPQQMMPQMPQQMMPQMPPPGQFRPGQQMFGQQMPGQLMPQQMPFGQQQYEQLNKPKSVKKKKKKKKKIQPEVPIINLPAKKKKVKISKRVLRILTIRFAFIAKYVETLRQNILFIKKFQLERLEENKDIAIETCVDAIEEGLKDSLLKLLNQTEDLAYQIGRDDQLQQKANFIYDLILLIMKDMEKSVTPDKLGREFFLFMLQLCKNGSFPPKNYYLDFELKRLEFTNFGALKNVTALHENMILNFFVILRNVIFLVVIKAWKYHPDQTNTDRLFFIQRNALIFASVFHNILVDYYQEKVPFGFFDMQQIEAEDRVQSIPILRDGEAEDQSKTIQEGLLIADLLQPARTKRYIDAINKDSKKIPKLREVIFKYGETLREALKIIYEEERFEKERMAVKIQFFVETKDKHNQNVKTFRI